MSKTHVDINKIINKTVDRICEDFSNYHDNSFIVISTTEQQLYFIEKKTIIKTYLVSTAKNGVGNLSGSYKTPLGIHAITEKIGAGAAKNSIFKARINTNELAKVNSNPSETSFTDNITSRILRLKGLEKNLNKGANIDSYERYIYIHGTDEEGRLGQAVSHGCIRMANQEIIELFELLKENTIVNIVV